MRSRVRYLSVLALLALLVIVPWRGKTEAQSGSASPAAAEATGIRGVGPSATVLLQQMEGVFQRVGLTHLSLHLVEAAPTSRRTLVRGHADVLPRDHRGTWIEQIQAQPTGFGRRTVHAEIITIGSYTAQRVGGTPWLCTVGQPFPEASDPTLSYRAVVATLVGSGTVGSTPVWHVSATVIGPNHGRGTANYYITQSGSRLLRLDLTVVGQSPSGVRGALTGWITYSRYGERLTTRLPRGCRYLHIDPTGVEPFIVEGEAMMPTLRNGQMIWVDRLAYRGHLVHRGDIIVFKALPAGVPDKDFIKRVIGLPGETVAVHGHRVYINGRRLREPYVRSPADYVIPPMTMPAGRYFVLGDDRNNSFDSHIWPRPGLPMKDIIGRALLPRVTYS